MEHFEVIKNIRHNLTAKEKEEVASDMAQATVDVQRLEEDLVGVKSSFKARIDEAKARVGATAQTYNCGFDYRPLTCQATIDGDRLTIRHPETGEIIENRTATDRDKQICLKFNESA